MRRTVLLKHTELLQRGVILLQDNARHIIHLDMQNLVQHCGVELLARPPYSPGIAPCNCWLLASVKEDLRSKQFEW